MNLSLFWFFAAFGGWKIVGSAAPKGRKSIAQGNALGFDWKNELSPEGASVHARVPPLRGYEPSAATRWKQQGVIGGNEKDSRP
jgi:hypothetical protein